MPPFDYDEDAQVVGVFDELALIGWITFGVVNVVGLLFFVAL